MDAKSRADFINSVATGAGIPCPKCNNLNESDSSFCIICGTALDEIKTEVESQPQKAVPAFSQVNETKMEQPKSSYKEPESVFAQGLPSWSVEPPQVVIRRHK